MKRIGAVLLLCVLLCGIVLTGCKSKARQVVELLSLGEEYLAELDYENALLSFAQALEIDEKNAEAYIGMAKTHAAQQDYAAALAALDEALAGRAGGDDAALGEYYALYTEALQQQARLAQWREEKEKAVAVFAGIRELDDLARLNVEDWRRFIGWVRTAAEMDDVIYIGETDAAGVPSGQGRAFMLFCTGKHEGYAIYDERTFFYLYEGAWADGAPHGQGRAVLNGSFGYTIKTHNSPEEYSSIMSSYGTRRIEFEGTWSNGLPNGRGVCHAYNINDAIDDGDNTVSDDRTVFDAIEGNLVNGLMEGAVQCHFHCSTDIFDAAVTCRGGITMPQNFPQITEGLSCETKENFYVGSDVILTVFGDGTKEEGPQYLKGCPHTVYSWFGILDCALGIGGRGASDENSLPKPA